MSEELREIIIKLLCDYHRCSDGFIAIGSGEWFQEGKQYPECPLFSKITCPIKITGFIEMEQGLNAWHKSERKKWALELLPKESEFSHIEETVLLADGRTMVSYILNKTIAELRKKIEEE